MSADLVEGGRIMLVGITGVFANLVILMAVVKALGLIYGKKKKKAKKLPA